MIHLGKKIKGAEQALHATEPAGIKNETIYPSMYINDSELPLGDDDVHTEKNPVEHHAHIKFRLKSVNTSADGKSKTKSHHIEVTHMEVKKLPKSDSSTKKERLDAVKKDFNKERDK